MTQPTATARGSGATPWFARAAWVSGLLGAWLLLSAGWRPLMLPDEGRYVGVAWEMLNGDLLLPTLLGLPYFHKPPLMYWIDMAAIGLLGPTEFAARVAPAIGAWLMGAALWLHLRRSAGARMAALGLGVLATTPFFFVGGQFANHDMLVAGWITVAITCAVRALEPATPHPVRWVASAWAAAAAAVLSKGLIGVVLPALVLLPWLAVQGRWRDLLRLLHPAGIAAFVLLAAPWFVAMHLRVPGFLDYFFVEQHFRRYAQGGFNNPRPAWFFFVVLPLLTLPWSLWLWAAWRSRRAWRGGPADRARGPAASGDGDAPAAPSSSAHWGLHAWWVLAVLLFFSLPRSKLVGYVLPALAPWAALLGGAVARGRGWRILLPLAALACLGLVAGVAWKGPATDRDIGLALGQRLQAGERVVFVGEAFFDVPFYARMQAPPVVLLDWHDPSIPNQDNWRKELWDAARFAQPEDAARLWSLERRGELLCGSGRVWFVAARGWQPPEELPGLERVAEGRRSELWRGTAQPGVACR